jgi:hypothetical protein
MEVKENKESIPHLAFRFTVNHCILASHNRRIYRATKRKWMKFESRRGYRLSNVPFNPAYV